jgi:ADP-ribose pyrophosphatase YjhB (NUDIX family)
MDLNEKSNLLAVDVVVHDGGGNILLHQRSKEPDAGKWELFASYPYLSERPLEKAVRRILKEKAGIEKVASIEFSGKFYDDPNRHVGASCIPLVFVAVVNQDAPAKEGTKWFSTSAIGDLPMALDNKQILRDLTLAE